MKQPKRRAQTNSKAVKQMEKMLGVKLKSVGGGFHLAVLPKDHPMAKKAGTHRLLFKVVDADTIMDSTRQPG